jgi:hypothetical protein
VPPSDFKSGGENPARSLGRFDSDASLRVCHVRSR